ncbi:MAG: hypothetical protein U0821_26655 [Chloroflexota bacterium]
MNTSSIENSQIFSADELAALEQLSLRFNHSELEVAFSQRDLDRLRFTRWLVETHRLTEY